MVQVCSGLNHLRYFFVLQKQLKVAGVLTAETQGKRHDRWGGRLHNHCDYRKLCSGFPRAHQRTFWEFFAGTRQHYASIEYLFIPH